MSYVLVILRILRSQRTANARYLGSARVPRAGEAVSDSRTFPKDFLRRGARDSKRSSFRRDALTSTRGACAQRQLGNRAGCHSAVVSGIPRAIFIACTACPAIPLPRLSRATMTAELFSFAATAMSAKLVPVTAATLGLPSTIRTNGQSSNAEATRA